MLPPQVGRAYAFTKNMPTTATAAQELSTQLQCLGLTLAQFIPPHELNALGHELPGNEMVDPPQEDQALEAPEGVASAAGSVGDEEYVTGEDGQVLGGTGDEQAGDEGATE
jgi:hypothetical protein